MKHQAFVAADFDAKFDRIPLTEITNAVHDLWFQILDDGIFTDGGEIFGQDIALGDWVEMRMMDRDGVVPVPVEYGGDGIVCFPAGTIFKTWIPGRNIHPTLITQIRVPYVGNPPKLVMFNIRYHKTGAVNPKVCFNLDLHKQI